MSDSLALLELPELQAAQGRWADLGAGAGIHGLPLAVAMPAASVAWWSLSPRSASSCGRQ